MEHDFIAELERKVDALVEGYTGLKKQNEELVSEIKQKNHRIQELEGEHDTYRKELHSLKDISADQQKKLDTAAKKVKDLITKLEAVEQD